MKNKLSSLVTRKIILEQSYKAHVGHIGSCLCVADILTVLYREILQINSPDDPARDRFVLSKGHVALTLFAVLYQKGWLNKRQISTFHQDDTFLGVHPEHKLRGIDFSTGSVGQGITYAVGAALAAKLQQSHRQVYALISDAECNEGSVWEAVLFAATHNLDNLTVVIDYNGQQAFGYLHEVISLHHIEKIWKAHEWNVHEVDGHDDKKMIQVFKKIRTQKGKPKVVIARTTFGKGVSYMNSIDWHYLSMNKQQYNKAMKEIETK